MKLALTESVAADLRAHARTAYPHECCGLLIGKIEEDFGGADSAPFADESKRLDNTWETPALERRYRIDSLSFAKIEQALAGLNRGIIGIYHSHPNHSAWPSPFDLDHAWPSYAYLIVSVREGRDADARVWRLSEDRRSFIEGTVHEGGSACR